MRARFRVGKTEPTQIAIRQITQRGMLEHIVAIPFNHRPIELLPPASGQGKGSFGRPAQRRHRRRPLEIALKVPIGPEFSELLRHYSRTTTVRSAPGYVCPTDNTDRVSFAPIARGSRDRPLVAEDVGIPGANVNVHHAAPSRFS